MRRLLSLSSRSSNRFIHKRYFNNSIKSATNGNKREQWNDLGVPAWLTSKIKTKNMPHPTPIQISTLNQFRTEQKNRYKLGLEPLPPFVSQNASNI